MMSPMLSTNADPFDVAREEVEAAVRKIRFMTKEWRRLLEAENTAESQKFRELHSELAGELQQLDYDLQELDRSIAAVEANRERFKLSDEQLEQRRGFVKSTRGTHREIQAELSSPHTASKMAEDKKKSLMTRRVKEEQAEKKKVEWDDEAFQREQQVLQRQLYEAQEDELTQLSKTTQMLGVTANTINGELESQQVMLDELNLDIDMELQRMNTILKGAGQVLKTSNRWQIYTIVILVLLFFVMLTLFIWT